jgi:hypothetical protein
VNRLHDGAHLAVTAHDAKAERDFGIGHHRGGQFDVDLVAVAQRGTVVGLGMTQGRGELLFPQHSGQGKTAICQETFVCEVRVVENSRKKYDPGGIDILKSNIDRNLEEWWASFEEVLPIEELHGDARGYSSLLRGVDLAATVRPPPMREQPLGTNRRWARRSTGLFALLLLVANAARAEDDGFAATNVPADAVASAPIVLGVRAETGVLGRSLRYTDPLLRGQRPADNVSPATPMLRLRLESYPLAALSRAWPASLGLHVDVSGALPTDLRGGSEQSSVGTQSQGQLLLGAQGRIRWAALEFTPHAAWGLHGSYLRLDDGTEAPLPDVTYSFLEFGLRLRGRVEALTLEAQLAFRQGLSAGEIASAEWFPNTTYLGVASGVAVAWNVHHALALRVGVDFIQYGLTFNPDPGRPPERVVGGATDRSVSATLGLEWRLPSPAPSKH